MAASTPSPLAAKLTQAAAYHAPIEGRGWAITRELALLLDDTRLDRMPHLFDSRIYHAASYAYPTPEQDSCASCVLIAATTVATVRADIVSRSSSRSAHVHWREGDDESFARACVDGRSSGPPRVPPLSWKVFHCGGECGQGDPAHCYAPYRCNSDGIVPEDFLSWVADVGFRAEGCGGPVVIPHIRPVRPGTWFVGQVIRPLRGQATEAWVRQMIAQRQAIKRAILDDGPVMAMIRIDTASFKDHASPGPYRLPHGDAFDELHEVIVVGWTMAPEHGDHGRYVPCWIVQNTYGTGVHTEAYIDPTLVPPTLRGAALVWREAWSRVPSFGRLGCVLIEMARSDLLRSRRGTYLENHALAFTPVLRRPRRHVLDVLASSSLRR